jgi:hypothetical protein
MNNEDTVRAINQEITIDLLEDQKLLNELINELQAVLAGKLGKK